MIGAVVAGLASVVVMGQEQLDLRAAQACMTDMLIVETAIEENHWVDIPGVVLPRAGSQYRIMGIVLLIDAFAKAAEREGVDPAGLEPDVRAAVDQAPRPTTALQVAALLKREAECFALVGVGEP